MPQETETEQLRTLSAEGADPEQAQGAEAKLVVDDGFATAPAPRKKSDRTIRGLFSTQTVENVGTGTTLRRSISKTYWFAEENDAGQVLVQPINAAFVPSGPKVEVQRESLLRDYNPEPEYYQQKVYPKLRELEETIDRAEKARENGHAYSAEFEFGKALNIDVDNVRANFGLGLTYMDRGDTARADDIFQRIVHLEAAFSEEHKHLFNDFGINLRKSGLLDQAVEYYSRALAMAPADENLHYNIARAFFEKGDAAKCLEHLETCLGMNACHHEAQEFAEYVRKLARRIQEEEGGAPRSGQSAGKATSGSKGKIVLLEGEL
jgi:tetratricopeptide (TPR) repeat protein